MLLEQLGIQVELLRGEPDLLTATDEQCISVGRR
jgi:hypothetical protein